MTDISLVKNANGKSEIEETNEIISNYIFSICGKNSEF